jgi:hypothetical protein
MFRIRILKPSLFQEVIGCSRNLITHVFEPFGVPESHLQQCLKVPDVPESHLQQCLKVSDVPESIYSSV